MGRPYFDLSECFNLVMFIPEQLLPPNCLYRTIKPTTRIPITPRKVESKTLSAIIDPDPALCFLFACRSAFMGLTDNIMYPNYDRAMFASIVGGILSDVPSAKRTVSTIINASVQDAVTAPFRKLSLSTGVTADVVSLLASRDVHWAETYMRGASVWYPMPLLEFVRQQVLGDNTLLCSAINAASPRGSQLELMYIHNVCDLEVSKEIASWMGVCLPIVESYTSVHDALKLHL